MSYNDPAYQAKRRRIRASAREHMKYVFNEECSSAKNENADCSTERSENASFFFLFLFFSSSSFFFFFFSLFSFFLFLFFSFSFRFSTEGPDADIPPYADILSISGSGSDDEDATDVQKLDAAQPDMPEICF